MSKGFKSYSEASSEAHRMADAAGTDVAIRKGSAYDRQFNGSQYVVAYAAGNDSDYALAEIVRPAEGKRRSDAYNPPGERT